MYQNNGYQQNGYQGGGYQQNNYQQPAQNGNALGWDDDFEAQESSFVLLPEGDYAFEITKLEKARHSGSEKVPPCNKAIVTFCVHAQQGDTYITENYLLIDLDWARRKMTEFFSAIGFAEKGGQRVRMHWGNDLIGRRGVCHVAPRKYKNNDGDERETNDLKKLYPIWNQPNLEPIAPPQNTGYMQPNQGYQTTPAQGYNPAQNAGYQPQNGWNGGGIY
jgi:hypothetical protein